MNKPTGGKIEPLLPLKPQAQTLGKIPAIEGLGKGKAITKTQDEYARALEKTIAKALAAFKGAPSPKIFEQKVSVNLGGRDGPDEQSLAAILRQFGTYTILIVRRLSFDDAWPPYRAGQDITFRALNQKWKLLWSTFDLVKEDPTMKVFQTQLAEMEKANQDLLWEMLNGGE
ncbi:hypothetical protein J1614_000300 [Plenodomus biglobosus]|nr:hypothetical protein J1614_000300 [Plenodomus biglobosus]